ncbi:MAG: tetratricopeptide repeat protein [Candidatus Omnitrophica bacterium]|nr:tetratricopeptide repeat protein [Candidatus Omnitrophota bacterium]
MKMLSRQKRSFNIFILVLIGVFIAPSVCPADMVWNQSLNRLVRIGEEIKETDKEQFEYANSLIDDGKIEDAITACNDLLHFFPKSLYTSDIYYTLGKLYEETKDYYKAFEMYQRLMKEYPNTSLTQDILDRQFSIGVKFLEGERLRVGGVPTIVSYDKAIEIFKEVKKSAPFHEYGEKSQFNIGSAYEKKKDYEEAMAAFEDLLDEYPNTELASEASFKMADLVYKMSQRNVDNAEMLESAGEKFDEFLAEYPNELTKYAKAESLKSDLMDTQAESLYKIGRFYEDQRHLESAKIYYVMIINEYPETRWRVKADERIAIFADPEGALREKEDRLRVEFEQVEAAGVKLEETRGSFSQEEYKAKRTSNTKEKKRLLKEIHDIKKRKIKEIKLRWSVHKRKKEELRDNKKALKKKQASLSAEALAASQSSLKTWENSIKEQEFLLQQEEETLKKISGNIGYRSWSIFAFISPPIQFANIDGVIGYKEDKITKLRTQREAMVAKTEDLIAEREKMLLDVDSGKPAKTPTQERFRVEEDQVDEPEGQNKAGLLKTITTKSLDVITVPAALVVAPFKTDNVAKLEEVRAREDKIVKAIDAAQHSITEIDLLIGENDAAVKSEQDVPGGKVVREADADEIAERDRRRAIKSLEKEINEQYRIIDDAEKRKNELANKLLTYSREGRLSERPVLRIFMWPLKPVIAVGRGVRMFIFGIKKDETLAEEELARYAEGGDDVADESSVPAELRDQLQLENEKINVAKIKLKELYAERDELMKEKGGFFRSILIFPTNIFGEEKVEATQNRESLEKMKAKQSKKIEDLEADLAAIREEIAVLTQKVAEESDQAEAPSGISEDFGDAPTQAMGEQVEYTDIEDDKRFASKQMRQQIKKLDQTLKKNAERTIDILNGEEEMERERLVKIDETIKKFEGSESEKLQKLVDERKAIYGVLDTIMTTRERYLLILQEIKKVD